MIKLSKLSIHDNDNDNDNMTHRQTFREPEFINFFSMLQSDSKYKRQQMWKLPSNLSRHSLKSL